MKCMILAAGLGTRLRPITNKIPKPAVRLLNVPLFNYSAELLAGTSPTQIVVNAHSFPKVIQQLVEGLRIPFVMSLENEKPLGSGGGLKHAEKYLAHEPFLAMNADNVIIPASEGLVQRLWKTHNDSKDPLATLLVIEDSRVGKEFNGVWFNVNNELQEVTKTPVDKKLKGLHFTGVAIYSPRIFKYLPSGESNIFSDAILPAIQSGEKVVAHKESVGWFETGDLKSFLQATHHLLNRYEALPFLNSLVKKYSPDSVYKKSEGHLSLISSSARISKDSVLKGFLVAGQNSEIRNGCSVNNCVLQPGGTCESSVTYENQIIL